MKFNPAALKGLFGKLAKSGVADDVAKGLVNSADDVALGALNVADDMPTSISFDDIADAYKNRIPIDKPPTSPKEFVQNYKTNRENKIYGEMMDDLFPDRKFQIGEVANAPMPTTPPKTNADIDYDLDMQYGYHPGDTFGGALDSIPYDPNSDPNYLLHLYDAGYKFDNTPDYDAMRINPIEYGQSSDLVDRILYPDGFKDPMDFTRYHMAKEQGYSTRDLLPYEYLGGRTPPGYDQRLGALQTFYDPYTNLHRPEVMTPELAKLYKNITGL